MVKFKLPNTARSVDMLNRICFALVFVFLVVPAISAQVRQPATSARTYVVKKSQQVAEIQKMLAQKTGNVNEDIVAAAGEQTRVAIFRDAKRENDLNEIHDNSDDIYYVLQGEATLMLGGTLVGANEVSPGEWRAKEAVGGEKVVIRKGDLIFIPRGTRHQRTVAGKAFEMILIKVFADRQPLK